LKTARLELRPVAEGDLDAFRAIYPDAAGRELADALAARADGLGWWLALEDGEPVAAIELHAAGEGITGIATDEVEIGWVVVGAARGRGIATEAAAAVARHALDVVGVPWLVAYVRPWNVASLRVAEKLGMAYEGDGLTRSGDPMRVFRLRMSPR
jgi:RimJ/RimL family protein N-acetyltransferase